MLGFGQFAFTVVAKVTPEKVTQLSGLLTQAGQNPAYNAILGLGDVPEVHYASLLLFEAESSTWISFEGNIDGEVPPFFERLCKAKKSGIDAIFGCCVGYDSSRSDEFLKAHDIGFNTFYVGTPGRTVRQILLEKLLHSRIEEFIDHQFAQGVAYDRNAIIANIKSQPDLNDAFSPFKPPFYAKNGAKIIDWAKKIGLALLVLAVIGLVFLYVAHRHAFWIALGVVVAIAAVLGLLALKFRYDEKRDKSFENRLYAPSVAAAVNTEDFSSANHMISVVEVKPGIIRLTVLRFVLWAINLLAVLEENQGQLAGIPSIHFARWVILNKKTLLFYSNYGGSWDSYLEDFIVKGHLGLTAVWSNSVGFPPSKWLLYEGATHEVQFKVYARNSMAPTLFWYQAYPDLSVQNIDNNTSLRVGLIGTMTKEEEDVWLARL